MMIYMDAGLKARPDRARQTYRRGYNASVRGIKAKRKRERLLLGCSLTTRQKARVRSCSSFGAPLLVFFLCFMDASRPHAGHFYLHVYSAFSIHLHLLPSLLFLSLLLPPSSSSNLPSPSSSSLLPLGQRRRPFRQPAFLLFLCPQVIL